MFRIRQIYFKVSDNLTEKEVDILLNFEVNTSNFMDYQKFHKSTQKQNGIQKMCESYNKLHRPTDLKLPPIVAGPTFPTQRLRTGLDIILKPICKLITGYIRDDMDSLKYRKYKVEQF